MRNGKICVGHGVNILERLPLNDEDWDDAYCPKCGWWLALKAKRIDDCPWCEEKLTRVPWGTIYVFDERKA